MSTLPTSSLQDNVWDKQITKTKRVTILCTAYCGCGHCCGWEWGLTLPGAKYLALGDFGSPKGTKHPFDINFPSWNPLTLRLKNVQFKPRVEGKDIKPGLIAKYWVETCQKGEPYLGITSSGVLPKQARPPVLSSSQLVRKPLHIPLRLLTVAKALPQLGTVAADTRFYGFGTRMLVPGYGWAEVQDEGGAIKGQFHVDLFHHSHQDALEWGKQQLSVAVLPKGKHPMDDSNLPAGIKPLARVVHDVVGLFFGFHH
eukprot:TRINITY_DN6320_c0_g1_i1.p1 TRINITY_DN6320_c0_g1~~TRINITY_DN6320_c0_g1_i1.p1  ORF type:complete len:256 (+),score=27.99 TRINITY_DN6320_c0_g1_i1:3-770(+)